MQSTYDPRDVDIAIDGQRLSAHDIAILKDAEAQRFGCAPHRDPTPSEKSATANRWARERAKAKAARRARRASR